jgi:hypothetical protein
MFEEGAPLSPLLFNIIVVDMLAILIIELS